MENHEESVTQVDELLRYLMQQHSVGLDGLLDLLRQGEVRLSTELQAQYDPAVQSDLGNVRLTIAHIVEQLEAECPTGDGVVSQASRVMRRRIR